jgi:hypothetical protein
MNNNKGSHRIYHDDEVVDMILGSLQGCGKNIQPYPLRKEIIPPARSNIGRC